MSKTRWGIIGPGAIAHNFADGLIEAKAGTLVAIASRSAERRKSFGDAYTIASDKRYKDYGAMVRDRDVDAIYVATPHPWHAELSIMAMRAGKPVLCEKPAGMNAAEVIATCEVAAQQDVFFMEGYMYRCHPQIARVIEIIQSGEIGDVVNVSAQFGFNAGYSPTSRLYAADLGGGAILDVGGYPVSLARLIAGVAQGMPFEDPVSVKGAGILNKHTGVDEVAYALLGFASGVTAQVAVAIARNMENIAIISGSKGSITILNPWVPGRDAGPSDAVLEVLVDGTSRQEHLRHPEHLFAFEAQLASKAIAAGMKQAPFPALSHADSIGNNKVLDAWREELDYRTFADRPNGNRILAGTLPGGLPDIPKLPIEGVQRPVSKLIMGCDNRATLSEGAIVWDAWMEAGGNAFDTAFVYGGGLHEKVLGEWIAARGVADEIVVIGKGAHTPYCTPRAIGAQLDISLQRLGLDRVPIYIMHRDNPDVPVGEFIDALNALHDAGKIGVFGGSNWTPARFAEANDYAARNGLQPMRILNNNLSLAVMKRPVWPGCVSSNNPETRAFLAHTGTAHLSWSSQARGYFLPENLQGGLPADSGPDLAYRAPDNEERLARAQLLASERGVSANNVAMAWVLAQDFLSFALIGPRSAGEIASTLPGLAVKLTPAEVAWLNLESDTR